MLDFGLAKQTTGVGIRESPRQAENLTQSLDDVTAKQTTLGTLAYMSPEQARGQELDARSDIFSLGCVLYEMATGRPPFTGDNTVMLVEALLMKAPTPAARLNPDLPSDVERVINKALEKDKTLRFQSAAELLADLKRIRRDITASGVSAAHAISASGQLAPFHRHRTPRTSSTSLHSSTSPHPPAPPRTSKGNRLYIGIGALVLAAAVGAFVTLRPTPAPALTDRDLLLVADFKNSTTDPVFDDALKQALTVSLQQSPFLSLVSDQKMQETLRFMNRPPETALTGEVAREVCQRANAKALIAGTITAIGSSYAITLDARNCATGEAVASEQVEAASKEAVLKSLGSAASQMRSRLGESLASVEKTDVGLDQATTQSLDALKMFSLAQRTRARQGDTAAFPLYEQATKLDPDFAMAWARVSTLHGNSGRIDAAKAAGERAYALRSRANQPEQWYITSTYQSSVLNDPQAAAETLRLWHQAYPRDYVPPVNLARNLAVLGRYEEALRFAQTSVSLLQETQPIPYINVIDSLITLNRFDEAVAAVNDAISKGVPLTRGYLAADAVRRGDDEALKRELEQKGQGTGPGVGASAGLALADRGRMRESRALADRRRGGNSPRALALVLQARAQEEYAVGNLDQARAFFADSKKLVPPEQLYDPEPAVRRAAAIGDIAFAEAAAAARLARFPSSPVWRDWYGPQDRAAIALARGKAAEVLTLTEPIQPRVFYRGFVPVLRGLAQLQLKNGAGAATEFQIVIDNPGVFPGDQSLARVGLARAHAIAGDIAKARKAYEDFFEFWKRADPDLPLLIQAKAEYARVKE